MRYGSIITDFGNSVQNKTAGWRTYRAVIDPDKCIECGNCWIFCPEPCIYKVGDKFEVDLDFCKGCGICANECPTDAIEMILEEK
jgi:pyruvate ferredoxin oxidoreductase delta subunit|tara:strand:- start:236 stop:490 length:255 start_codon:yes stop_codon:yes gene_type:complete